LVKLKEAGFKTIVQIDCYLDEINRMRPLLKEILRLVDGVVMYGSVHERFGAEELESFHPQE